MTEATQITMPDEDLIERLRDIATQRAKTAAYGGVDEKLITEWIAADRIASLLKEAEDLKQGIALRRERYNLAAGEVHDQQGEIASLKAENERLREALRPFAEIAERDLPEVPIAYLEKARAALSSAEGKTS